MHDKWAESLVTLDIVIRNSYYGWGSTSTGSTNCELGTLIFKYKAANLQLNLCQLFSVFYLSLSMAKNAFSSSWLVAKYIFGQSKAKETFRSSFLGWTCWGLGFFTNFSYDPIWNEKRLRSVVNKKSKFKLQNSSFLRMCCLTPHNGPFILRPHFWKSVEKWF